MLGSRFASWKGVGLAVASLLAVPFFPPGFFNLTLREFFSPSRALICDLAEKNATRSGRKKKVGAALETAPRPPFLWGFREKDD
jgi:hypothetical protein